MIRSHNYLPEEFPKTQALFICDSLGILANGTAEGCRIPLEHARARLGEIRRTWFDDEVDDELHVTNPKLRRGDTLDRGIAFLIAAVTTALDAYRQQAAEGESFDIEPQEYEVIGGAPSDQMLARRADDIHNRLGTFRDGVQHGELAEKDGADDLARQVTDSQSLVRAAQAELNSRVIVRRWLSKLAGGLRTISTIIGWTGNSIIHVLDIGEPLYKRWDEMWDKFTDFTLKELRLWAEEVAKTSERVNSKLEKMDPVELNVLKTGRNVVGIYRVFSGRKIVLDLDGNPYKVISLDTDRMRSASLVIFDVEEVAGSASAINVRKDRYCYF